jgi:predicted DNA-binding protein (UPF0251 family)
MSKAPADKKKPIAGSLTRGITPDMLTPDELDALRLADRENAEYGRKVFAYLRTSTDVSRGLQAPGPGVNGMTKPPEDNRTPDLKSLLRRQAPEMLTPSELESLRLADRETADLARKAFAHLRPKD